MYKLFACACSSRCLQNPRYDILVTEDGRRKKLKKSLPPGLSTQDERVLKTVQRKAYRYEWWIGTLLSFPWRLRFTVLKCPLERLVCECSVISDKGDLEQLTFYSLHPLHLVAQRLILMYRLPLLLRSTSSIRHCDPLGLASCGGW